MSLDLTDKSTLVQVMAWCHQATSLYLSQCWPRPLSPSGVTKPQWVLNQVPGHIQGIRPWLYDQFGLFWHWIIWGFAGINIATINYKASLVQFMAGHRVGGKPLSEPSINTLHKCIYMYTPSRLDLLTYRVLLLTVIVEPQRAIMSAVSTLMATRPSRLWWNLSLDRKLL